MRYKLSTSLAAMTATLTLAWAPLSSYSTTSATNNSDDVNVVAGLLGKTASEAISALKHRNFDVKGDKTTDGLRVVHTQGSYCGERKATVLFGCTSETEKITSVCVVLPVRTKWGELAADFSAMSKALEAVYGKPTELQQSFDAPAATDADKLNRLKEGNCNYVAQFNQGGRVTFTSVTWSEEHGAHVCVFHIDQGAIGSMIEKSLRAK